MENETDSKLWEQRHSELTTWQSNHGNCNVPKAEGKLGRWVVRQRELHKKGKLEPERKKKLDKLGFVWNTNEAAWEHRYALLIKYAQVNGHCCVPISDATLGMWVAKMRANRRRDKLSAHRIDKLNAINFVWNTAEADWMDKYNRLLEFRRINGHSCVPFNEGELGWWVNTQRQNKRKGKLIPNRETLLNQAVFVWNPQEFLAARRRQQAAARASAAHAIANRNSMYYQHSNALPYSSIRPHQTPSLPLPLPQQQATTPTYTSSTRKRKHMAYCEPGVNESVESPTSIKRTKYAMPSMLPSVQRSPRYPPSLSWMTTPDYQKPVPLSIAPEDSAQKATSIASLLSPLPKINGIEQGGLDVLSSVCEMPIVNSLHVNSLALPLHTSMKLPPISAISTYSQSNLNENSPR